MAARYAPAVPTGLHGWIESNNARSLKLFGGFALAMQVLAAGGLLLPLTLIDPGHSLLFAPAGYLTRYVPFVFAASLVVFAAQMFWYMETVKNAAGFRFVDAGDEPRLCRVIEPLILQTGIPVPFCAVIDTPQRNAFACGISRRRAVVVVTRGLLEALNDAELAAVLAHELAHIRNGDIRLLAAANICLRNAEFFKPKGTYRFNFVAALICVGIPVLFPLILLAAFAGQTGHRWAFATRLAITSSREFIADAQAAELTRNPAALASALLKINGQHRIAGARRSDDAAMIAGESEGPEASHPAIGERIAALTRVTGSMVFIAPGAAPVAALSAAARSGVLRRRAPGALRRAHGALPGGWSGFERRSQWVMAATILAFLLVNLPDLENARAMAAKFDIRYLGIAAGLGETNCRSVPDFAACLERNEALYHAAGEQHGTLAGMVARHWVAAQSGVRVEEFGGESGQLTGVKAPMNADGLFASSAGLINGTPPVDVQLAEIDRVGCFPDTLIHGDPQGRYRLNETFGEVSLTGFVARAQLALIPVNGGPEARRDWLYAYAEKRGNLLRAAYDLYGLPGLSQVAAAFASPAHAAVIAELREALRDPAFVQAADGLRAAKLRALARDPARFVPCQALRHGFAPAADKSDKHAADRHMVQTER